MTPQQQLAETVLNLLVQSHETLDALQHNIENAADEIVTLLTEHPTPENEAAKPSPRTEQSVA